MSFMHLNDFIKHNKFTHNSKVFIANRNYTDPQDKESFKCPLGDFKDSHRPVVRQHIVDKHSRNVLFDEAEHDIDDPKPPNDSQEVEKYPKRKRIIVDNCQHAQGVKTGKKVVVSKREMEKDSDDLGLGVGMLQTEVDILKESRIKEENYKKEESKTRRASQEDTEPLQKVTIDPNSFNGKSEKSEFSCNFCKLKLKTAIMLKNHIMRIHLLKNKTPNYSVYYMQ